MVLGWPRVPCKSVIPRACQKSKRWMERLRVALDILSVGINDSNDRYQLFYRSYETGLLDAAILLRDAFKNGVFGPKEDVTTSVFRSIGTHLKCKPARSNREQILAVVLESIG